jgi:uncharacterized protein YkwD
MERKKTQSHDAGIAPALHRRLPVTILRIICVHLCSFMVPLMVFAQEPPATQPAWTAMSIQEFIERPEAQRELDPDDFDQALLAAAIHHATNRQRIEHKLRPLRHEPKLDEASFLHARDMARDRRLGHDNPDPDRREPADRVRAVGLRFRFVAENVATHFSIQYESGRRVFPLSQWGREGFSYRPDGPAIPRHSYWSFADSQVQAWMGSPPHRQNILSPHPTHHGAAAVPEAAHDGLRHFYSAQLFFAPMSGR